jgi:hypothetical protein
MAHLTAALKEIHDVLVHITDESTKEDTVVILVEGRESVYVQFALENRGEALYGETVSNVYLDDDEKLSPEQEQRLIASGWKAPDGKEYMNFHRTWRIGDPRSHDIRTISREVIRALAEVYNVHDPERLMIEAFEGAH